MLIEQVQQQLLQARKAKDSRLVTILTTLFGEAQMIGKNAGNRQTTDAEVIALTKKFIDKIDETLSLVKDEQKRVELNFEKQVLSQFMPAMLSEQELTQEIQKILQSLPVVDKKAIGLVNKSLKENFAGRYNGQQVNEMLKTLIP